MCVCGGGLSSRLTDNVRSHVFRIIAQFFQTFQLKLKWMSLIKLLFGLSDASGSIFLCPPFVFADT